MFWDNLPKKKISIVCREFDIASATAKKYISMTEAAIQELDNPRNYKSRKRAGDDFVNIIYKMMADGYKDETIYQYLRKVGIQTSRNTLCDYIHAISKENFPYRKRSYGLKLTDEVYPNDVTIIKRTELLKYILTIDPKKEKDKTIADNLGIIKDKYPIVEWISNTFHEFHEVLMGGEPEALDKYILKYSNSEIASFCNGLKKDIDPVKNAISLDVSSGFVEGNNNKFKLIKRIVYGRSKIVNLTKKCKLAFLIKTDDFNLMDLV